MHFFHILYPFFWLKSQQAKDMPAFNNRSSIIFRMNWLPAHWLLAAMLSVALCFSCSSPAAETESATAEIQRTSPPIEVVALLMGYYESGMFIGDIWIRAKIKNNTSKSYSFASVYITSKKFTIVPPTKKGYSPHPDCGLIVTCPEIGHYPSESQPWKPGETITLTRTYRPFTEDLPESKNFQQWDRNMFDYLTFGLALKPNELLNITSLVNCYWDCISPTNNGETKTQ